MRVCGAWRHEGTTRPTQRWTHLRLRLLREHLGRGRCRRACFVTFAATSCIDCDRGGSCYARMRHRCCGDVRRRRWCRARTRRVGTPVATRSRQHVITRDGCGGEHHRRLGNCLQLLGIHFTFLLDVGSSRLLPFFFLHLWCAEYQVRQVMQRVFWLHGQHLLVEVVHERSHTRVLAQIGITARLLGLRRHSAATAVRTTAVAVPAVR